MPISEVIIRLELASNLNFTHGSLNSSKINTAWSADRVYVTRVRFNRCFAIDDRTEQPWEKRSFLGENKWNKHKVMRQFCFIGLRIFVQSYHSNKIRVEQNAKWNIRIFHSSVFKSTKFRILNFVDALFVGPLPPSLPRDRKLPIFDYILNHIFFFLRKPSIFI